MELNQFARNILFESDLEIKLTGSKFFSDNLPKITFDFPEDFLPARPNCLKFSNRKSQTRFPGNFESEKARAEALHFFANHELLALELMAVCLLKFPEAPLKFRLGLSRIMLEEQSHMRLYLHRMRALGLEFGEISVNGHFWELAKNITSPFDFTARMSLTFEQANLDYSCFYLEKFTEVRDFETAEIMNTVLTDEIGHVAHGVQWFKKWQDPEKSLWQAYAEALILPLSPARGKGMRVQAEPRLKAGLPQDFIENIDKFGEDRNGDKKSGDTKSGDTKRLFIFNPQCEMERADKDICVAKVVERFTKDVGILFALLAKPEDYFLGAKPTKEHSEKLGKLGFVLPKFVEFEQLENYAKVIPWGHSPFLTKTFTPYVKEKISQLENTEIYEKVIVLQLAKVFCEVNNIFYCAESVSSEEEIVRFASKLQDHSGIILKSMHGASGRGNIRLFFSEDRKLQISKNQKNWIENQFKKHRRLIVEPLYKVIIDFSHSGFVSQNNLAIVQKGYVARFKTTFQGQYYGHYLGKKFADLNEKVTRFWHEKVAILSTRIFNDTANYLGSLGYSGPFGVDGFVYETAKGDLGVIPMIDLNVRYTFAHIAAEIEKKIAPGRSAFLNVGPLKNFNSEAEVVQDRHRKLLSGTVLLTEKNATSKFGASLIVN